MSTFGGWSNYHGWENTITKRMSNRWQAQLSYSLSKFRDADGPPFRHAIVNGRLVREELGFRVAPDLGEEYTLAASDQRHRAVFNGIWEGPAGVQVSGLYFYGSGQRNSTSYGGDLRNEGAASANRLRPDGTISARNNHVGEPIHRVDVRLQKRVSAGGRRSFDGILEVFNVFNRANYGSYTTQESNANFGKPTSNTNIAYQPRSLQLGFRFAF
jgi:hypothetical protein